MAKITIFQERRQPATTQIVVMDVPEELVTKIRTKIYMYGGGKTDGNIRVRKYYYEKGKEKVEEAIEKAEGDCYFVQTPQLDFIVSEIQMMEKNVKICKRKSFQG